MIRHVLGISGGKDSAALAIYMKEKYPDFPIDYYNSDTGCDLEETEHVDKSARICTGAYYQIKSSTGKSRTTTVSSFPQIEWRLFAFASSSMVYTKNEIIRIRKICR
jgi:tRNA(Ile)-lysidine synthase TilS/MesJ